MSNSRCNTKRLLGPTTQLGFPSKTYISHVGGEDMRKEDAHRKHTGMDDCAHPSGCQGDMRNDGTIESIWVEMTAHIRQDAREICAMMVP